MRHPVTKNWQIKERLNAQFRAEFFNLLNETQFTTYRQASRLQPASFGLSTTTNNFTGDPILGRWRAARDGADLEIVLLSLGAAEGKSEARQQLACSTRNSILMEEIFMPRSIYLAMVMITRWR